MWGGACNTYCIEVCGGARNTYFIEVWGGECNTYCIEVCGGACNTCCIEVWGGACNTYFIEVWGGACNTYFSSLINLQKYTIRLIMSAPYRAHTDQLFKNLLILPIRKIYEYTVILFMYKNVKNIFPSVMTSMFNRNNEIHKYRTHHAELLHVPISKSIILYKTIRHCGVKLWNYMVKTLDCTYAFVTFKSQLEIFVSK